MYQGKPQKFGLQYVPDGVRLRVWDVNPETTDEERAAWDVPPLEKLYEVAKEATEKYGMSTITASQLIMTALNTRPYFKQVF